MKPEVKQKVEEILRNGMEYLEEDDYESFYRSIPVGDELSTGYVTVVLMREFEDPSRHMDFIPEYYLAYTNIKSYNITNKFKRIELAAFANSEIELTAINCEEIGVRAFYGCRFLSTVKLGLNVKQIEYRAFIGCQNPRELHYQGSLQDWKNIKIDRDAFMKGLQIICSDGSFIWL